jgi:chromosome segregation ATPase
MIDSPPASLRARRPGLRAFTVLSFLVLGAGQASALPQVQMEPWPGFLLVQAAEPAEPTIPREQPGAEQQAQADQQVPLTELNEVLEVLEATRTQLEELFGATEGMQQALQRSSAEAQRLDSELAATKGQLSEATTAGAEAERAHQLAVSEAQQLRGEAERASAELVAARKEIERFQAANGELEQQIASLNADSKWAMDTARQTLTVMEEKIRELNAALAGAGLTETTPGEGR